MRAAGLQGVYRRRRHGCTVANPADQPAADLVTRSFAAGRTDALWLTDITEHPTLEGKVYCAAVMDSVLTADRGLVDRRAHAH
jgi:putative transposase